MPDDAFANAIAELTSIGRGNPATSPLMSVGPRRGPLGVGVRSESETYAVFASSSFVSLAEIWPISSSSRAHVSRMYS